jgi:hypothetical protein
LKFTTPEQTGKKQGGHFHQEKNPEPEAEKNLPVEKLMKVTDHVFLKF